MLEYKYILVEYWKTESGSFTNVVGFYKSMEEASQAKFECFKRNAKSLDLEEVKIFKAV